MEGEIKTEPRNLPTENISHEKVPFPPEKVDGKM